MLIVLVLSQHEVLSRHGLLSHSFTMTVNCYIIKCLPELRIGGGGGGGGGGKEFPAIVTRTQGFAITWV